MHLASDAGGKFDIVLAEVRVDDFCNHISHLNVLALMRILCMSLKHSKHFFIATRRLTQQASVQCPIKKLRQMPI